MITAIVLAAEEPRSMGRQKVLWPYGDSTVLGHILGQIAQTAISETLVVTGHEASAVAAALAGKDARAVFNPNYKGGALSSIRTGLTALPRFSRGVMVVPGDHPEVTAGIIAALIGAFEAERGDIVLPVCDGRRVHPVLFDASYRSEILAGFDDTGLEGLYLRYPKQLIEIPWEAQAEVPDLDTPAEYEASLARRRGSGEAGKG